MSDTSNTGIAGAGPEPVSLPTRGEVRAVIPDHCFERNTWVSVAYLVRSLALAAIAPFLAWQYLPLTWAWLPVWLLYGVVGGTMAGGLWVIAHEAGHGAFSDNKRIETFVGFTLHSAFLVPYFNWQRIHALHHAKTNHLTGDTVLLPNVVGSPDADRVLKGRKRLGRKWYPAVGGGFRVVLGWPIYLFLGTLGYETIPNHFWPDESSQQVYVGQWKRKAKWSTLGVLSVIAGLIAWSFAAGSVVTVLALYGLPFLFGNGWLVLYTWLHHTHDDITMYDETSWDFMKGAFGTVDRPYGIFDFLHLRIGSTHTVHHLFPKVPHYKAKEANDAIRDAFPEHFRYDPTPFPVALWRAARDNVVIEDTEGNGEYRFASTDQLMLEDASAS